MLETETYERDRQQEFLFWVAVCLIAAVVLFVAGAIFRSNEFHGISARNRLELISESANIVTAAFVLGAVAALSFLTVQRIERARPVVVITLIVGTAIALLALYSVVDILTLHISSASSADQVAVGVTNGGALSDRLGVTLPAIGALLITIVALVGGNQLGFVSGSREISDDPQDLPEVE